MSRPLTEYTNEELLEAVRASARHVGDPYDDILAEMNRRVLTIEAKVKALKVWTAAMVGVGVLVFVTTPTYFPPMLSASVPPWMPVAWPPWLPNMVWVLGGWFIGVMVLLVAGRLGAFPPADPSTASGPDATIEGPPPEPPAFLLTWDWRKCH